MEGQPEADGQRRHPLHRHRSLPRPVGEHDRVRSRALRSDQGGHRQERHRDRSRGHRPLQRHGHSRQRLADLRPTAASPKPPPALTTTCSAAARIPNYFSKIRWGQFQPRVGFAYRLNDKTVIRAGGGRFITRLGVSDSVFLGGNPPFQPTANVTFGSADNPGGNSANSLPLTVTTQSRDFKNPEAWNWNFTVERELPWNSVTDGWLCGTARTAPAARVQHQPADRRMRSQRLPPAPTSTTCGLTRATTRSARPTTSPVPRTTRCSSPGITASPAACMPASFTPTARSWTMARTSATSSRTPTTRTTCGGRRNSTPATCSSPTSCTSCRSSRTTAASPVRLLGGWQISGLIQYQSGTPTSIGRGTDYAGVGLDGSLAGGIGQYLGLQQQQPRLPEDDGPQQRKHRRQLVGLSL